MQQAELNLYQNADKAEDPTVRKKLLDTRSEIEVETRPRSMSSSINLPLLGLCRGAGLTSLWRRARSRRWISSWAPASRRVPAGG